MLKSPIIYDCLFSLFILAVISASSVVKMSMSARGCEFGQYITPTIIDFVMLSLSSITNVSIT